MMRMAFCLSLCAADNEEIFFLFLFPQRPSSSQPYFAAFHITLRFVFVVVSEHSFLAPLPPAFFFAFFLLHFFARRRKKRSKKKKQQKLPFVRACVFSQTVTGKEKTGAGKKTGAAQILALFVVCLLALIHGRSSARLLFFVLLFFPFFKVHVGGGGASQCVAA